MLEVISEFMQYQRKCEDPWVPLSFFVSWLAWKFVHDTWSRQQCWPWMWNIQVRLSLNPLCHGSFYANVAMPVTMHTKNLRKPLPSNDINIAIDEISWSIYSWKSNPAWEIQGTNFQCHLLEGLTGKKYFLTSPTKWRVLITASANWWAWAEQKDE